MESPATLDIIIPCYDPRPGWEKVLSESISEIGKALPENVLQSVILVNDGSNTGVTEEGIDVLGKDLSGIKLIEYRKNMGKGFAVRKGVRSSEADIRIYTDIDMPYENAAIVDFYGMLSAGEADIVVTDRGDTYYRSLSFFRRMLSRSLRWLNGFLFGLRIKDTQGGLKGFNANGREVFLRTRINRYLFDLEFIQLASAAGLRLQAMDVKLKPGILLPAPGPLILFREMHNLILLLIRKR